MRRTHPAACERGPYFFHGLAGTPAVGQAAINARLIQATGIHYAGSLRRRP